jgi:hypothetical protein
MTAYGARNITIDNALGDPIRGVMVTYHPPIDSEIWDSSPCPECWIQPDLWRAMEGTWTSITVRPNSEQQPSSIELRFNGNAFILTMYTGSVNDTLL